MATNTAPTRTSYRDITPQAAQALRGDAQQAAEAKVTSPTLESRSMDDVPVHPWLLALRRRNQETSGNWDLFGSHRQRVTDLLASVGSQTPGPPRRLTVLGAGNSNDVDLTELRAAFTSVCLVDWDADALSEGIARQGLSGDPFVRAVGGDGD